ncbi:MAG: diguanylate cyclase [Acidobacteria bacterium]|nr:diguanylate cyclase [Acidobacteriota bacterium]MBV9477020.1 diguanylate cyclase [Acidobacteriota bacterium]
MTDHAQLLLVEDDENLSLLLRRRLERAGYVVRTAGTIAEARAAARVMPWDLVLLDRGLPDGDGFELCRELRAASPHGYIILLTGESSDEAKLDGFRSGADDYVTKPFLHEELFARIRAGIRIVTLQRALLESNRRLEELSLTDGLTALRNRRAFDEELAAAHELARRYDRPLSLAIIDVDHFKGMNDTHGHAAGDAVLRAVAQLIAGSTRATDFVARIGGEEFAVLLPETGLFDAMQFAEKIRASVAAATIRTGEVAHRITVSVGIASEPHTSITNATCLFEAADQALYRAKQNGRNRVELERRRAPRKVAAAARPLQIATS